MYLQREYPRISNRQGLCCRHKTGNIDGMDVGSDDGDFEGTMLGLGVGSKVGIEDG